MLVSHNDYVRNEEDVTDLREAVVQGSIDRVVPILTTALCTGLALVPVRSVPASLEARFKRPWQR